MVKQLFDECGNIRRIELNKDGKGSAAIRFDDDDGRGRVLLMHNKKVDADGDCPNLTLQVEGLPKRFTTEPMEILQAHTDIWSKEWKAGQVESVRRAAESVSQLLKQVAIASNVTHRKTFTAEQIRKAAKQFKRKTSTGADHWTFIAK